MCACACASGGGARTRVTQTECTLIVPLSAKKRTFPVVTNYMGCSLERISRRRDLAVNVEIVTRGQHYQPAAGYAQLRYIECAVLIGGV